MFVSPGTTHRTARQAGDLVSLPARDLHQSPSHGPGDPRPRGHGPRDPLPLATGLSGREAGWDSCLSTGSSVDGQPRARRARQGLVSRHGAVRGQARTAKRARRGPASTHTAVCRWASQGRRAAWEPHWSAGLVSESLSQSSREPDVAPCPTTAHQLPSSTLHRVSPPRTRFLRVPSRRAAWRASSVLGSTDGSSFVGELAHPAAPQRRRSPLRPLPSPGAPGEAPRPFSLSSHFLHHKLIVE